MERPVSSPGSCTTCPTWDLNMGVESSRIWHFSTVLILSTGDEFSSEERRWVLFWTCRWISSMWLWYGFEGQVSDQVWSQISREGARQTPRSPLNCSKCDLLCSWVGFLSFVTPQKKEGMIFGRVGPHRHSLPLRLNPLITVPLWQEWVKSAPLSLFLMMILIMRTH